MHPFNERPNKPSNCSPKGGSPTLKRHASEFSPRSPKTNPANVDCLLIQLTNGEMEFAAKDRCVPPRRLRDPVFQRLAAYFESISSPSILHVSLRPLPFSYRIDDLPLADTRRNSSNLQPIRSTSAMSANC